jgi:hypothetical protein
MRAAAEAAPAVRRPAKRKVSDHAAAVSKVSPAAAASVAVLSSDVAY